MRHEFRLRAAASPPLPVPRGHQPPPGEASESFDACLALLHMSRAAAPLLSEPESSMLARATTPGSGGTQGWGKAAAAAVEEREEIEESEEGGEGGESGDDGDGGEADGLLTWNEVRPSSAEDKPFRPEIFRPHPGSLTSNRSIPNPPAVSKVVQRARRGDGHSAEHVPDVQGGGGRAWHRVVPGGGHRGR